jgi:hypothetical protein
MLYAVRSSVSLLAVGGITERISRDLLQVICEQGTRLHRSRGSVCLTRPRVLRARPCNPCGHRQRTREGTGTGTFFPLLPFSYSTTTDTTTTLSKSSRRSFTNTLRARQFRNCSRPVWMFVRLNATQPPRVRSVSPVACNN